MKKKIVLFDGECNYCNWWINFLLRADKKDALRFATMQSEDGKKICRNLTISSQMQNDTFILVDGEKYFISSNAGLHLLKELGGGYQIFYALIIIPRPIRDFFYGIISRNRYRWFGKSECMIPDEKIKNKFVIE